jgi:hypothetical protein
MDSSLFCMGGFETAQPGIEILCASFVIFVLFVVDFVLSRHIQADWIKPQRQQRAGRDKPKNPEPSGMRGAS